MSGWQAGRRGCLRTAAGLAAGLAGLLRAQPRDADSDGDAPPPIPFFDAHVHLNDVEMQLKLMDRFGARRAVIFWGRQSDNASVLAAARAHPARFVAFASVSPERSAYRPLWDREDPAVLQLLEDALREGGKGVRGIGEISAVHFPAAGFAETDYDPLGSTMRGIFEIARRHALPVLLHVEITRLRELSALMDAYPGVRVLWAHGGYTPLFLAERMLARHPQLTYELSARSWPMHPRSPDYTIFRDAQTLWPPWKALIERQPQRFVVGTDASHRSWAGEEMKARSVQRLLAQIAPPARALVAYDNLAALLGS
ncbi:amidohydrolase family protein [Aquabacterium humicola]|uniref:amidohydrolase family protein n=1 Tax=Aquabacterium humicola TaxID=3237377 RepID=UPI0025436EB5|nr:amidohydrolase family protein [Rubrivivax pictus]